MIASCARVGWLRHWTYPPTFAGEGTSLHKRITASSTVTADAHWRFVVTDSEGCGVEQAILWTKLKGRQQKSRA